MLKLALLSLIAAVVLLVIANTSTAPLPFLVGRAFMMIAVLCSLASITVKLIADTNTWSLRYRR